MDWVTGLICFECFLERKESLLNAKVKSQIGQAFLLLYQGYTPHESARQLDMPVADVMAAARSVAQQLAAWRPPIRPVPQPVNNARAKGMYDRQDMVQEILLAQEEGKSEKEIKRLIWRIHKQTYRYRGRTKRLFGEPVANSLQDIQSLVAELTG